MPILDLDASNFPPSHNALNTKHAIQLSKLKAIKFAQTVGNAHYSPAYGRTQTALSLAAYRAMAVRCVLRFNQPTLQRLVPYKELEGTEKVNLSYWIGMTIAAVAADDLLGVPRLTHASKHSGILKVNPKSRRLADLVGQDGPGGWHVIEAKGRQDATQPADEADYKAQATTVKTINGVAPTTTSFSVAFIRKTISAKVVDPPSAGGGVDLRIDPAEFTDLYYQPFREFIGRARPNFRHGNRAFVVRPISYDPIDRVYVYVGLEERFLQDSSGTVQAIDDPSVYVGRDGVAVVTSNGPCDL